MNGQTYIIPFAILGILFFSTSIIAGIVISNYQTNKNYDDSLNFLEDIIVDNNGRISNLKSTISELERLIKNIDDSDMINRLKNQIENLRDDIEDLEDSNDKLENRIEELKKRIDDLILLISEFHY